jgi:hypothetical protein
MALISCCIADKRFLRLNCFFQRYDLKLGTVNLGERVNRVITSKLYSVKGKQRQKDCTTELETITFPWVKFVIGFLA